jgi:type VI secretion system protein VasG
LNVDEAVIEAIAARCREVESGARNVDHILRGSVLPLVSSEILRRMADDQPLDAMRLVLDAEGNIAVAAGSA